MSLVKLTFKYGLYCPLYRTHTAPDQFVCVVVFLLFPLTPRRIVYHRFAIFGG